MATEIWIRQLNGSYWSRSEISCKNPNCTVLCGWLRDETCVQTWCLTGLCQSCQDKAI